MDRKQSVEGNEGEVARKKCRKQPVEAKDGDGEVPHHALLDNFHKLSHSEKQSFGAMSPI